MGSVAPSKPGGHPLCRAQRCPVARRLAFLVGLSVMLGLLLIPTGFVAEAHAVQELRAQTSVQGIAPFGPLRAANTVAGAGACRSTEVTTLPFGVGSARASIAVTERRTCPTLRTLTFLPSARYLNGLAVPAGHVLNARLDLIALTGTTAMASHVELYLQRVGGGNPIVTPIHIVINNGLVVTASTSAAVATTPLIYGLGLVIRLVREPVSSTISLTTVLVLYVNDAGIQRALDQERLTMTITY